MMSERRVRCDKANELLRTIGDCGRRFFHDRGYYGHFVFDDGRLIYVDEYTHKRMPVRGTYLRRGFTGGGTLNDLVIALARYIRTGKGVGHRFGPWPKILCDGDLWGYGDAMVIVRQKATDLGVV